MPEYLGYKIPENYKPIDFAGITAEISANLKQVEQEKEEKRAAIDQGILDAQLSVNEFQFNAAKTSDKMWYDGAVQAREKIATWEKMMKSGQMDPREFNSLKNGMLTGISNYSSYLQELGSLSQQNMERMQPDENGRILASWYELMMVEERDRWNDFSNQEMMFSDDDGRPVFIKRDADGNIVSARSDIDMLNMNNAIDNRYYMSDDIESFTEQLKSWKTTEAAKGGTQTYSGAMQNPSFSYMRSLIMNTVLPEGDDKRIADVLIDNGAFYSVVDEDIQVRHNIRPERYKTEEELASLIEKEVSLFNRTYGESLSSSDLDKYSKLIAEKASEVMVQVVSDNKGNIHPVINDTHKQMAMDAADAMIASQLEYEATFRPKAASVSKSSGSGVVKPSDDKRAQLYVMVQDAIKGDYGGLRTMFDYNRPANNTKLTITPKADITDAMLIQMGFEPGTEVIDISSPNAGERLAKYAGTTTPANAASDYGFGRQMVQGGYVPVARRGQGTTSGDIEDLRNKYNY